MNDPGNWMITTIFQSDLSDCTEADKKTKEAINTASFELEHLISCLSYS